MADEATPPKEKKPIWKPFPIGTRIKAFLRNRFGFPLKDTREAGFEITAMEIYERLSSEVNFGDLKALNELMVQTEQEWEGADDEGSKKASAAGLMEETRALYCNGYKGDGKVNEGLGPYSDGDELQREVDATQGGTGSDRRAHIIVNVGKEKQEKLKFNYILPKEEKFRHGDWEYNVAFFGNTNDAYWQALENDIQHICNQVRDALIQSERSSLKQQYINRNIENYKRMYTKLISIIREITQQFENNKHFGNIGGGRGVVNLLNTTLPNLMVRVMGRRIKEDQVFYNHTYRIIKPYYNKEIVDEEIEEIKEDSNIKTKRVRLKERVYFDSEDNPYLREKANIENQIQNEGDERVRDQLKDDIERLNQNIATLDTQILNKVSNELQSKNIFGSLAQQLFRDFGNKLRGPLGEIIQAINKVLWSLRSLLLQNKKARSPFRVLNDESRLLHDLGDFVRELQSMDNATFRHHVTSSKNDFENWIRDQFGDKDLEEAVGRSKTKEIMYNAVMERLKETPADYQGKTNNLFSILEQNLDKFIVKVKDENNQEQELINEISTAINQLKRNLPHMKNRIIELPHIVTQEIINQKQNLLIELYMSIYNPKNENSIFLVILKKWRSQLSYEQIKNQETTVASAKSEDIITEANSLFNKIEVILKEFGYKDNEIAGHLDTTRNTFLQIFSQDEIQTLFAQRRALVSQKREQFLKMEKIIRLIFRRDQLNRFISQLKPNHANFRKYDDEQGWGLDENGWPLEVGDGKTRFGNVVPAEGEVMIDDFKGRSARKVDKEFIGECDLLNVATWIYVSYDAYRDDMRDGRYHKPSMSIMEKIMTDLKPLDWEGFIAKPDFQNGTHAKIRLNLNKAPAGSIPLRPSTDPDFIDQEIKPTHLNPAFDYLRATKKSIHMGRAYYYEGQEDIMTNYQSNESEITTRGAALYILHRVNALTKFWGDTDQAKEGVIQLLKTIGEQTAGFDIGPNIGRWGKPLTKNPFNPQQSG